MGESLPARVKIVEVAPRDGLQNEPRSLTTAQKVAFIARLVDAGLKHIEATAFVHPEAIPQLADAVEVVQQLDRRAGVEYSALVPNEKGLDRAIASRIPRIAVFTAASDTFTQRNINMTVEQSLAAFAPVVKRAQQANLSCRGYVSTAFVCPYEGIVKKERVLDVTRCLLELGVDEVAISDTLGAAVPSDVCETVGFVLDQVPASKIALHFHDTFGTALANVYAGLQLGISTFDAAAGGLGGCPYAPGAAGNLATEKLVYMLEKMGIDTGVNLEMLAETATEVAKLLGHDPPQTPFACKNAKPS